MHLGEDILQYYDNFLRRNGADSSTSQDLPCNKRFLILTPEAVDHFPVRLIILTCVFIHELLTNMTIHLERSSKGCCSSIRLKSFGKLLKTLELLHFCHFATLNFSTIYVNNQHKLEHEKLKKKKKYAFEKSCMHFYSTPPKKSRVTNWFQNCIYL